MTQNPLDSAWKIAKGLYDVKHAKDDEKYFASWGFHNPIERRCHDLAIFMLNEGNDHAVAQWAIRLTALGQYSLVAMVFRMRKALKNNENF